MRCWALMVLVVGGVVHGRQASSSKKLRLRRPVPPFFVEEGHRRLEDLNIDDLPPDLDDDFSFDDELESLVPSSFIDDDSDSGFLCDAPQAAAATCFRDKMSEEATDACSDCLGKEYEGVFEPPNAPIYQGCDSVSLSICGMFDTCFACEPCRMELMEQMACNLQEVGVLNEDTCPGLDCSITGAPTATKPPASSLAACSLDEMFSCINVTMADAPLSRQQCVDCMREVSLPVLAHAVQDAVQEEGGCLGATSKLCGIYQGRCNCEPSCVTHLELATICQWELFEFPSSPCPARGCAQEWEDDVISSSTPSTLVYEDDDNNGNGAGATGCFEVETAAGICLDTKVETVEECETCIADLVTGGFVSAVISGDCDSTSRALCRIVESCNNCQPCIVETVGLLQCGMNEILETFGVSVDACGIVRTCSSNEESPSTTWNDDEEAGVSMTPSSVLDDDSNGENSCSEVERAAAMCLDSGGASIEGCGTCVRDFVTAVSPELLDGDCDSMSQALCSMVEGGCASCQSCISEMARVVQCYLNNTGVVDVSSCAAGQVLTCPQDDDALAAADDDDDDVAISVMPSALSLPSLSCGEEMVQNVQQCYIDSGSSSEDIADCTNCVSNALEAALTPETVSGDCDSWSRTICNAIVEECPTCESCASISTNFVLCTLADAAGIDVDSCEAADCSATFVDDDVAISIMPSASASEQSLACHEEWERNAAQCFVDSGASAEDMTTCASCISDKLVAEEGPDLLLGDCDASSRTICKIVDEDCPACQACASEAASVALCKLAEAIGMDVETCEEPECKENKTNSPSPTPVDDDDGGIIPGGTCGEPIKECMENEMEEKEANKCLNCVGKMIEDEVKDNLLGGCPQIIDAVCSLLVKCECQSCIGAFEKTVNCQLEELAASLPFTCEFSCEHEPTDVPVPTTSDVPSPSPAPFAEIDLPPFGPTVPRPSPPGSVRTALPSLGLMCPEEGQKAEECFVENGLSVTQLQECTSCVTLAAGEDFVASLFEADGCHAISLAICGVFEGCLACEPCVAAIIEQIQCTLERGGVLNSCEIDCGATHEPTVTLAPTPLTQAPAVDASSCGDPVLECLGTQMSTAESEQCFSCVGSQIEQDIMASLEGGCDLVSLSVCGLLQECGCQPCIPAFEEAVNCQLQSVPDAFPIDCDFRCTQASLVPSASGAPASVSSPTTLAPTGTVACVDQEVALLGCFSGLQGEDVVACARCIGASTTEEFVNEVAESGRCDDVQTAVCGLVRERCPCGPCTDGVLTLARCELYARRLVDNETCPIDCDATLSPTTTSIPTLSPSTTAPPGANDGGVSSSLQDAAEKSLGGGAQGPCAEEVKLVEGCLNETMTKAEADECLGCAEQSIQGVLLGAVAGGCDQMREAACQLLQDCNCQPCLGPFVTSTNCLMESYVDFLPFQCTMECPGAFDTADTTATDGNTAAPTVSSAPSPTPGSTSGGDATGYPKRWSRIFASVTAGFVLATLLL